MEFNMRMYHITNRNLLEDLQEEYQDKDDVFYTEAGCSIVERVENEEIIKLLWKRN